MKRFRRPSPALVLSIVAVVMAVTGTAMAAGTLKLADSKERAVTGSPAPA